MVTDPSALQGAALEFCNALRERAGLEPVSGLLTGRIQDSCRCPIARTAGRGWHVCPDKTFRVDADGTVDPGVPTPRGVREFLEAFDAGAFPHLSLPFDVDHGVLEAL